MVCDVIAVGFFSRLCFSVCFLALLLQSKELDPRSGRMFEVKRFRNSCGFIACLMPRIQKLTFLLAKHVTHCRGNNRSIQWDISSIPNPRYLSLGCICSPRSHAMAMIELHTTQNFKNVVREDYRRAFPHPRFMTESSSSPLNLRLRFCGQNLMTKWGPARIE